MHCLGKEFERDGVSVTEENQGLYNSLLTTAPIAIPLRFKKPFAISERHFDRVGSIGLRHNPTKTFICEHDSMHAPQFSFMANS
jgi:hypothetical protein